MDRPRPRPMGGAGTSISAGLIHDLDPNTALRGDLWYGQPGKIGIGAKMLTDPHVRQSLAYLANPCAAAVWDFEPADPADELDLEIARFCRWAFITRLPWDAWVDHCVTSYARDGFSLYEMTDGVRHVPARFRRHTGNGLGVVPTGLHHRPAWTVYRWIQSQKNPAELAAAEQWIQGSDEEDARVASIPAARLLRFTWQQDGADYEGNPILRSAYGSWKILRTLMVLEAIRHERQGVGVPRITLPEGADPDGEEADWAADILADMRSHEKGYLILPFGYEFKWEQVTGEGTAIRKAIADAKDDIASNVGFGHMRLGNNATGQGSYALASTHEGVAHSFVERNARFVAAKFQSADGWSPVRRIVAMNYGLEAAERRLPTLVPRNLPTINWVQRLQALTNATTAGLLTPDAPTEAIIREAFALPPHDPTTARHPAGAQFTEAEAS